MKNNITQILVVALLSIAVIIGGTSVTTPGQDGPGQDRTLEGTWTTLVIRRDCQTGEQVGNFQGVLTFARGGTLVGDSSAAGPATKSASYGVWRRTKGWNEYEFGFVFFLFNPDGTLFGRQVVRQSATLSEDGQSFTTTGTFQVYNAAGAPVGPARCATSTGTRFEL